MIVDVAVFNKLKNISIYAIVETGQAFLELALGVKIFLFSDVNPVLHVAPHQSILFLDELLKLCCRLYVSEYFCILREGKLHCRKSLNFNILCCEQSKFKKIYRLPLARSLLK
jgi:hypothetical protein